MHKKAPFRELFYVGSLLPQPNRVHRVGQQLTERGMGGLALAILGGSVGALCGMRAFHHKTRHWYFRYGLPAILLAQCALALWLLPAVPAIH